MKYFVYVIISISSGNIYIGQTNNPKRRIDEHNNPLIGKRNKFTKKDGPWKIIFLEEFLSRTDSIKREKSLKSHKGRDWIKEKIAQRYPAQPD